MLDIKNGQIPKFVLKYIYLHSR